MWEPVLHNYTINIAVDGKVRTQSFKAVDDDDAHSKGYVKFFYAEEHRGEVQAWDVINDETGEYLISRVYLGILDSI